MDALGLPVSFGKPVGLPKKPVQENAMAGPSSGGQAGGRGTRGVVGGGKKSRGRGRGDVTIPDAPSSMGNGLKRPHPGSSLPSQSTQFNQNPRGGFQQPRGGRGAARGDLGPRGGMRGGRGGGRGGHTGGDSQKGFWKDSFIEDPWKELLQERENKRLAA